MRSEIESAHEMTDEPRDSFDGTTATQRISSYVVDYLQDDGIGLSIIVSGGRKSFSLSGEALIDFIRRSLHFIIACGGRIVKDGPDGWEPDDSYGAAPDEIVENVIRSWQAAGEPDPEWGQWWFVLPRDFGHVDWRG
jgi:hypothetical protein